MPWTHRIRPVRDGCRAVFTLDLRSLALFRVGLGLMVLSDHAMRAAGYDVVLYGKMDTGGGKTMLPPGATAGGYHVANNADWRRQGPLLCRRHCPL